MLSKVGTPENFLPVVDVEVRAIDVWTLTPDVSLGRKGGENRFGIGLLEQNLLGRGVRVGIKYKSTVDRDTLRFEYSDNDFLRDRYRLAATYSNNSDGTIKGFQFAKPFYALDRRRAGNLGYGDGMRIDRLYDRGEIVTEFNNEFDSHQAMLGWSNGLRNGWVRRLTAGVNYERNQFSETDDLTLPVSILPEDREFLYPFVGLEFIEDDFRTTVNFDQIHRTEDRFLGTSLNLQLGYSSKSAGSTEDAWHYVAGYSNGLISTTKTSLTFSSRLKGRWSDGDAQDAALSAIARFHRRLSVNQLFYAAVSGTAAKNLDIDNPLYLGGETGLRGYPLRYQNGESKALITLEHRLYSNWYPFRLVHIGAAIFFDAGRVWGDSPVDAENLGLLRDIGFGLRLGNSRSGNGKIIHIDIAFPLDGEDDIDSVQILIDAKASF
jgi:outer membrane protein assembly factor BamA